MLKNKVNVLIDGIPTMALVDTGATVSVMSLAFKNRLGHKVMFSWTDAITFRGVGGEWLHPLGVCAVSVLLAGKVFASEFLVLPRCSHDVILGIDFLEQCGASVDCGSGEISLNQLFIPALSEQSSRGEDRNTLSVIDEVIAPSWCLTPVRVSSSAVDAACVDLVVGPLSINCAKKNILVPCSVVCMAKGVATLWALNCSATPVVLPRGMKIAFFDEASCSSIAALTADPATASSPCDNRHHDLMLGMISKALSTTERQALVQVLSRHIAAFDFEHGDAPLQLPSSRTRHRIDTGSAHPIRQKPYRVSSSERKVIAEQVKDMMNKGVVQESSSPWAAPVILVRKKDGSWRFCVDYRRLNAVTKKDVYPLPRIDDVIDCLHAASYFSTLDLRSGYWQIPMEPEDKEKTAFVTPDGLFEFNVMPFGLCNAPATFERFMDTVLRGLKWEICMCYLDDVVIFGRTFEEHNNRLSLVLDCIEKAGLVLNSKKCRFGERQTLVLGHLVDKDGVRPDPRKIEAVSSFKPPQSARELRSFIGLCSYFRRFVPRFAEIVYPLTSILRQDAAFNWTPDCDASFSQLKFILTSAPLLRHFDPSCPPEVHTDASGIGIGAVLVQRHSGAEHVVAYASRCLSKSERNYTVTEQECLAAVFAVQKFRCYLYGRPFKIITDHHSLCWLIGLRDPSGRLARWALRLQEYDFTVSYKSGRRHADADCLSRIPLATTDCDADNFDDCLAAVTSTFPDAADFQREQRNDLTLDPLFVAARTSHGSGRFTVRDKLLYKTNYSKPGARFLLVVPESLRSDVLRAMHDDATSGHFGFVRTLHRTRERFYWPKMYETTKRYVASCETCQRHKRPATAAPGPLQPLTPPSTPFEQVGIDLLGPFPLSNNRNRWIIVCVDHLTRYAETAAIPSSTAASVAVFLLHSVVLRHGPPRVIISDRGRQFTADAVEELLRMCTTQFRHSTPYHPQTNGLVERTNRTLTNMLAMYVSANHKNWDDVLPFITYAYNTAKHETTDFSPFYLLYARLPRSPLDTFLPFILHNDDSVSQTLCLAEEARRIARLRTLASQRRSKERYDDRHEQVSFEKGDLVLLWTPQRKRGLRQKLLSQYSGPFVVVDRLSQLTYVIARLLSNGRRSSGTQLTHIARLKRFYPP